MSNWVHIAGVIRIDDMRFDDRLPDFEKLLGELPSGSENPLKYDVWVNPKVNDVAAYTVSIFGDLRDRNQSYYREIAKWWDKTLDEISKRYFIRQGVLTMHCDFCEPTTLTCTKHLQGEEDED